MNISRQKIIWVATLIMLTGIAVTASSTQSDQTDGLSPFALSAKETVNGSTLWLEINTDRFIEPVTALQIHFKKRPIPLFVHPIKPGSAYFGLVAVPLRSKQDRSHLSVEWTDANGRHVKKIPFTITAGGYRVDKLTVDPRKVDLNRNDLNRVKREKAELKQIWEKASVDRLWDSVFQFPIESEITSSFGNKRTFNGQLKSFHRGTDFKAATGKPIMAANSGTVKLAKELFFSGSIVIIDHGTGIFSMYAHLSRIDIAPGQHVEKGQQIGLSGATGRVNGPHLHWGVKVNGTYVDPLQFVKVISSLLGE
jgi:murein DD-endopeptidase MepM/ murein hydrolase activator NlpD